MLALVSIKVSTQVASKTAATVTHPSRMIVTHQPAMVTNPGNQLVTTPAQAGTHPVRTVGTHLEVRTAKRDFPPWCRPEWRERHTVAGPPPCRNQHTVPESTHCAGNGSLCRNRPTGPTRTSRAETDRSVSLRPKRLTGHAFFPRLQNWTMLGCSNRRRGGFGHRPKTRLTWAGLAEQTGWVSAGFLRFQIGVFLPSAPVASAGSSADLPARVRVGTVWMSGFVR